jgi:UDP-N-acetylmuramate--alanine ligase
MSSSFDVVYKGKHIGAFELPAPGTHNILNSLAAIGTALLLKVDITVIQHALEGFSGIQRRLEFKGEINGVRVYDDYGHHPAEIQATLKAVKEGIVAGNQYATGKPEGRERNSKRLIVLFQPHRYTRTKDLADDFSVSFHDADILIVLDIYPAGEKPIEGVNAAALVESIKKTGHKNAMYEHNRNEAIKNLVSSIREGDIFLTLGAGDVWKAGEDILDRLKIKS